MSILNMEMVLMTIEEKSVVLFNGNQNSLDNVKKISKSQDYDENSIVLVNIEGVNDTDLPKNIFLLENPESSLRNHILWQGIFEDVESNEYIMNKVKDFILNGNQLLVENYDFEESEPFYDYSK